MNPNCANVKSWVNAWFGECKCFLVFARGRTFTANTQNSEKRGRVSEQEGGESSEWVSMCIISPSLAVAEIIAECDVHYLTSLFEAPHCFVWK